MRNIVDMDNVGALSYEKNKREIRLANKRVKEVFCDYYENEDHSFYNNKPKKKIR